MKIAILGAAGKGERLGQKKPKALIKVKKKELFLFPLETIAQSSIGKILLVVPPDYEKTFAKIIAKKASPKARLKLMAIIKGGKERQDSVRIALKYLKEQNIDPCSPILVHNGANIFAQVEDFEKTVAEIEKGKGAAVALTCADTVRMIDKKKGILKLIERENLWRMQTPQGAKLKYLLEAFEYASKIKFTGTDEIELLNKIGHPVKIIESSKFNFKVTYPEDLMIAEGLTKFLR